MASDERNSTMGVVERVGEDGLRPRLLVLLVDGGEVVEGALLAVEELHHAHAGDVLLGEGVDPGGRGALPAIADADAAAEDSGDEDDRRNDQQRDDGQRPAHAQHDDNNGDQGDGVLEDIEHAGGKHLVERVDVGGDAGDEPADGIFIEKGDILRLDMAEDLAAHVEHDLLPGPLHQVGLQQFQQEGEGEREQIQTAKLSDAGRGVRGKKTNQPARVRAGYGSET